MSGGISVLHVDDDPSLLELTAIALERERDEIVVETATSVREGLERFDDDIECIVSDYQMPGMDGLDFLEAVSERERCVPFILFTGEGSEDLASEAMAAGATDYLRKGGGFEQYALLAERVERAVDRHRDRCKSSPDDPSASGRES